MPAAQEKFYVEIPVSAFADKDMLALCASIAQNAPTSTLYLNNVPIQSTVAAVAIMAQTWTTSTAAVAAGEAKLKTDKANAKANRKALGKKVQLLRSQIQDAAPTLADAKAMGVDGRDKNSLPALLIAPAGGTLTLNKRIAGQFVANATAVPGIRTYAVEISPEPMTPTSFVVAEGKGKTRTFKGYASGTRWWVHFASTRGQARSAWSPAVSILIP
jgi:hypothetical protein